MWTRRILFFKGDIFFNLDELICSNIDIKCLVQTDSFVPLTLKNFHKNENAYLNKALAIGIINDFVDNDNMTVFQQQLTYRRLLYGQFGKIKTSFDLEFKTSFGVKK